MLKVRVMPTLLYKSFGLVKGVGFDAWRRTGSAMQTIKVYNMREVDEIVFLDIAATGEGRHPDFNLVDELADECFMPMTVGGGVRDIDDVRRLLRAGADKVSLNSAAVASPRLIADAARQFGSQCITVSIDARRRAGGGHEAFAQAGAVASGLSPADLARRCENDGAGEILLTSIERDGTMDGYDIDLIRSVVSAVRIPVIASGGAGNYGHMVEALRDGGASAVAAASIFHFTEQTPLEAKRALAAAGFPVRLT